MKIEKKRVLITKYRHDSMGKSGRERGEENAAGEPQMEERLLTAETATLWWRTVVAIVIATTVVVIAASATLGVSGLGATFA